MRTRITPLLLAAAVCAANAGCETCTYSDSPSFYYYAALNVLEAPVKCADTKLMLYRDRKRAEEAWRVVRQDCPEKASSLDYADGFREGYVHYLEVGTCHPPAVPPSCYRLSCYQNPKGNAQVEDWFAGFRHGTAVAQASGYRETIVLPLSDVPVNAVARDGPQTPAGGEDGAPAAQPEKSSSGSLEELPAPRPVSPTQAPEVPPVGTPGPEVAPGPARPPGPLDPGGGAGRP